MKRKLLDVLCEPDTRAELELEVEKEDGDDIITGRLISRETGCAYPIRDGIPRFVRMDDYNESFGLQWNKFSQVQLDSANGATYSRDRFVAEVGWKKDQVDGRWAIDGGCGCGRFAEIAADLDGDLIALDFSSAVDAAKRNLSARKNIHFVQGDLLHLPFKKGSIDFAYSIGVLQHTPDPYGAMRSILALLPPGGNFAFTTYAKRWYTPLFSKYLIRPITKRLDARKLLRLVEKTMPVLFPLTDVLFRVPVLSKVFSFMIPVANYVHKTQFTREQRYQEAILDTYDMLSPAFDLPLTANRVESVFAQEGVKNYQFKHRVPVNVRGRR